MTHTTQCERSQIKRGGCSLWRAATGQSSASAPAQQMFTPHYRQPREETGTYIQTNKQKKTHNNMSDATGAHWLSSPAKNCASLSSWHPIIHWRQPGAAFIKHSLSNRFACGCCCCCRVFFVFFSELNLGSNVKELPPSTSSRWKVRSHFNHCDSLTGSPWFPRLAAF